MAPDAVLPDRCVKTDLPADGRTADVALLWHAAGRLLAARAESIVYLSVGTRRGDERRRHDTGDGGDARAGPARAPARGRAARGRRDGWSRAALLLRAELFWLGVALMALAIPVYLLGARFIRVRRLDGERVWIAGASVNFLARLPELPR